MIEFDASASSSKTWKTFSQLWFPGGAPHTIRGTKSLTADPCLPTKVTAVKYCAFDFGVFVYCHCIIFEGLSHRIVSPFMLFPFAIVFAKMSLTTDPAPHITTLPHYVNSCCLKHGQRHNGPDGSVFLAKYLLSTSYHVQVLRQILTFLKHQNTKNTLYNLSKNYWVIAFFELFGLSETKYFWQSLWITLYL